MEYEVQYLFPKFSRMQSEIGVNEAKIFKSVSTSVNVAY